MSWLILLAIVQTWTLGQPMPAPRFGSACVAVGDRVYLLGGAVGRLGRPVPVSRVDAYDAANDNWLTELAPMPQARLYSAGALLDGRIYVIGGNDGLSSTARVDRYDPVGNRWEMVAPLPEPAEALTAAVFDGRLYAIGGFVSRAQGSPGSYRRTVWRYIPNRGIGRWESVDSLNVPRAGLAAAVDGGRLYAIGGRYYNNLGTVEYWHGDRWLRGPEPMRTARSGHVAAGYDNYVVAGGGNTGGGITGSVELLHVPTGTWRYVTPIQYPRVFGGMALAAGKLVVVGGWGINGPVPHVETHEPFYLPGISEEESILHPSPVARELLLRSPITIDPETGYVLYDATGAITARGTGPATISIAPGVYFLRRADRAGTARLTVTR